MEKDKRKKRYVAVYLSDKEQEVVEKKSKGLPLSRFIRSILKKSGVIKWILI